MGKGVVVVGQVWDFDLDLVTGGWEMVSAPVQPPAHQSGSV